MYMLSVELRAASVFGLYARGGAMGSRNWTNDILCWLGLVCMFVCVMCFNIVCFVFVVMTTCGAARGNQMLGCIVKVLRER